MPIRKLAFLSLGAFIFAGAAKAPITLSPETTVISAPLRPDGWPDYVAALNARYSEGVTVENNGFVLWLKVVGTGEHVIAPVARSKMLNLLGVKDEPERKDVLISFHAYIVDQKKIPPGTDSDRIQKQLDEAAQHTWTKKDYPELADFLTQEDANLKLAAEAVACEKWWCPAIGDSMANITPPSLGEMREVTKLWRVQATRSAGQDNFPAFLANIQAIFQMARHIGSGPTIIKCLLSDAINGMAFETISMVAGSGKLNADQCAQLTTLLVDASQLPNLAEAININERWMDLDCVRLVAQNHADLAFGGGDTPGFSDIEFTEIDWDVVLKRINAENNHLLTGMNARTIAELHKIALANQQRKAHFFQARNKGDWHKRSDESKDAYSNRVAELLLNEILFPVTKVQEPHLRAVMQQNMTRAILGLAALHAKTGKWPDHLRALVPVYLKETPRDIYTAKNYDVKYDRMKNGVRLYSVGRNGIDDAGQPGSDDIVVGVH